MNLFDTLAYRIVTLPGYLKKLSDMGIRVSDWPTSRAKDIALQFSRVAKEKSDFEARSELLESLTALSKPSTLPSDRAEFLSLYDRFMSEKKALELAEKIIRSPESVNELIDGFKSTRRLGFEKTDMHSDEAVGDFFKWHEAMSEEEMVKIIPGFEKLSEMVGGFNAQRLTMITAESGVGKTTLAMALAANMTEKHPVLFVNMEMGFNDMMLKHVRSISNVTFAQWRKKSSGIDIQATASFKDKVDKRNPLFMTHGKVMNIDQIIGGIFEAVEENQVFLVVVDYDQKIALSSGEEEWRGLLKIITRLEQVAIQANCHIIVLSQGDEEGRPKASKRAIQPLSTQLWFRKDEKDRYFVTALKNRWGINKATTELNVDMSTGVINEKTGGNSIPRNSLYPGLDPRGRKCGGGKDDHRK